MIRNYFQARKLRPYKTCSFMLDLAGRKIKTSERSEPAEGIHFEMGATTYLSSNGFESESSSENCIRIDTPQLPNAVRPGDIISFNDGNFGAVVLEVAEDSVRVQFKEEGTIMPAQAIRIPGHRLSSIPILRQSDLGLIEELAIGFKMDYVCVPNVTSVKDLQESKEALGKAGQSIGIIAKVDNLESVHQFEGILKYADAVVVLRNELAFELMPEKLMLAQKWMIQTANMASVPIFLQSQVLETQVSGQTNESRQETQDISSSVIDGADAFILSHETSIGDNAADTTSLLSKAIAEAEQVFDHEQAFNDARNASKAEGKNVGVTDMLCSTATQIALDNEVDLFICLTSTGKIAKYLARQRPA